MRTKLHTLILCVSLAFTCIIGQTKVIDIWHGNIPGSIVNPDYKTTIDSADNWVKMRFVINPVLDVYPAPKELANGTAVILCPGGGYWGIAIGHEGKQVAEWFNSLGITAFVLKYRLPDNSIMKDKSIGPLQDGQEAVRIVRSQAALWNINPNKIGIMGFSAGGHIASTISTHYNEKVYQPIDTVSARPDFSILIYPVISMDSTITHMGSRVNLLGEKPTHEQIVRFSNELQVNKNTPPAFLIHSLDDNVVPIENSIRYVRALRQYNIPCELHLYESGGHGYGLGRSNNTESSWPEACKKWLKARGLLSL